MITKEFDTIAAISTPLGEGAIGIVRLSGTDALAIAQKVYRGKDLSKVASHTINYGHIVDPDNDEILDEVMVSVMLAPKTSHVKMSLRLIRTVGLPLLTKSCNSFFVKVLVWLNLVNLPNVLF